MRCVKCGAMTFWSGSNHQTFLILNCTYANVTIGNVNKILRTGNKCDKYNQCSVALQIKTPQYTQGVVLVNSQWRRHIAVKHHGNFEGRRFEIYYLPMWNQRLVRFARCMMQILWLGRWNFPKLMQLQLVHCPRIWPVSTWGWTVHAGRCCTLYEHKRQA